MTKGSNISFLIRWRDFRLKVFLEGIMIGFLVGLQIVLFRYLLEKADALRGDVYVYLHANGAWTVLGWFLLLVTIGLFLGFIVQKEPFSSGSGIPQVEGILQGHFKMNWLRVIIAKFIGGILGIGAGLSLGREGPSIQLGAAVGQGVSRLLRRIRIEEKYLITSGASAGLAAAFNAPLAGVMFAFEELHKNFSPAVLMSAMAASLTADVVTQNFFGQKPIFNFPDLPILPLRYYLSLIGLGLMCGAFGVLFNKALIKTLDMYAGIQRVPNILIPAIPLVIGGILGFVLPQALGGGHILIESLRQQSFGVQMLLILVVVKFLFTMASYGSGVPGGIFLPLLVIGALTGSVYGHLMVNLFGANPLYLNNFLILAMAAYFTAIVKAPVTGSILITEMTGSFHHLLALITVSMTAYIVSDLLKGQPVYEALLERTLSGKKREEHAQNNKKTILEIAVDMGSPVVGKIIKNIAFPAGCLLVNIKRGESEVIPKGNTKIMAGDYLYILVNESQSAYIKEEIAKLTEESFSNTGH